MAHEERMIAIGRNKIEVWAFDNDNGFVMMRMGGNSFGEPNVSLMLQFPEAATLAQTILDLIQRSKDAANPELPLTNEEMPF